MTHQTPLHLTSMSSMAAKIRDDLAKLDGKPPYNTPSNYCWGDGYFASSLEQKYGAPIETLRRLVGG